MIMHSTLVSYSLNKGIGGVYGAWSSLSLPFNLVEHACHVTMSVSKLLGRVQTPDMDINELKGEDAHRLAMSHIHRKYHRLTWQWC